MKLVGYLDMGCMILIVYHDLLGTLIPVFYQTSYWINFERHNGVRIELTLVRPSDIVICWI